MSMCDDLNVRRVVCHRFQRIGEDQMTIYRGVITCVQVVYANDVHRYVDVIEISRHATNGMFDDFGINRTMSSPAVGQVFCVVPT